MGIGSIGPKTSLLNSCANLVGACRLAAICCELLGLITVNVRSSHTPAERSDAVALFQDPDEDVDVFVSSITVSGTGLNLHRACHRGIILQLPSSWDKMDQGFGRLERVGQKNSVRWNIIVPDPTFYAWQESRLCKKGATKLATQVELHPALPAHLKEVILYELMREKYGMAWSRYAWVAEKPVSCSDYFDAKCEAVGRHYSLLAMLLLHLFPSGKKSTSNELEADKKLAYEISMAIGYDMAGMGQLLGDGSEWETFVADIEAKAEAFRQWVSSKAAEAREGSSKKSAMKSPGAKQARKSRTKSDKPVGKKQVKSAEMVEDSEETAESDTPTPSQRKSRTLCGGKRKGNAAQVGESEGSPEPAAKKAKVGVSEALSGTTATDAIQGTSSEGATRKKVKLVVKGGSSERDGQQDDESHRKNA